MDNDIYHENKRLRAENEGLRGQLLEKKNREERENNLDFLEQCIFDFFRGTAVIHVENHGDAQTISFVAALK